jgi:hypothetical protein
MMKRNIIASLSGKQRPGQTTQLTAEGYSQHQISPAEPEVKKIFSAKPTDRLTYDNTVSRASCTVFGKMKMDPAKRAQTQNAGEV